MPGFARECDLVNDKPIRRAIRRAPTTAGAVVGLVFWWFSLVPSLMPRAWLMQAAASALCVAIGYSLGTLGRWAVRRVQHHRGLPVPSPVADRIPDSLPRWAVWAVPVVLLVVVGGVFWVRWQNQQRDLLAMDHVTLAAVPPMLVVTVLLAAIVGLIGRLVGGAVRRLDRWNRRHLPGLLALPVTILLVIAVAGFLLRDVAATQFVSWADSTFSLVDKGTSEGTTRPTTTTASGGTDSLVDWDDLGLQGRQFVAHATSEADLEAFATASGRDAADVEAPIRAYAGLRSAGSAEARAQLAVDDLKRAGGFDRSVLVVATSTGTGWIDPDASRSLELMHGGDTAIVSMQYSFLPSWISFITDLDRASEAGAVLYSAVYDQWKDLPADDRPKLIAFGLSLGAYGGGGAFTGREAHTSIDNITSRSDGALFVGAPFSAPILRQLVDSRDAGSPAWAPVIDDGTTVRFETRDPHQPRATGDWDSPRVLFVQHPSDPVTHWYFDWLWKPPSWMDSPRGFDVPRKASWFPIVTGVQGVFDLMAGFGAPPGHGHDYRLDYPAAWADVVPPEGWTAEDTASLEAFTQAERVDAGGD